MPFEYNFTGYSRLCQSFIWNRVCKVFVEIRTTPIVGAGLRECQRHSPGPRPTVENAA